MITEFAIVFGIYGACKYIKESGYKYKKDFREIVEKSGLYNKEGQTLKVHKYEQLDYGYRLRVGIPFGISLDDIKTLEDTFKTNLGAIGIEIEKDKKTSMMDITIINKPLDDIKYKPLDTEEGEILVGYSYKDYIKINLNKFPHVLIGGDTGTGKSRLMLLILTNLINRFKDCEIYLIQIRKSDLAVFKECKQVKYMARNLEETRDILRHLDNICKQRDKKLERYLKDGIYNIVNYNKRFKNNKMKYKYIVLDEFAFFNYSGADSKAEKQIKKEILGYIKNIVLTGRSTGVFIFTSLQKPTSSSIPTDIKSQLTTRISFKMLDKETSIVILGNANATNLKEREAITRTLEEGVIKVPYIDHNLIMESIEDSIEPNHKYITIPKEEPNTSNVIPLDAFKNLSAVIETVNNDGVIDLSKFFNVN